MKFIQILLVVLVASLVGCKQGAAPTTTDAATTAAVKPLMTVNGQAITPEFFDFYVKNVAGKPASELTAAERTRALDSLARIYVLTQAAEKEGVLKDPENASRMELSRLSVLQAAAAQHYLKDKTPTEQELRAEYETQIADTPQQEFRARHILVQSPELAERVISQLNKGADFGKLAKSLSIDGSKENGGDLGWFSPNAMVKPFSNALMHGLKKGQFANARADAIWLSVIKLDDVREASPPSFDPSKEQLGQILQRKETPKADSDDLLAAAKIDPPLTPAADAVPAAAATTPATPSDAPAPK
ncbi:MAG: peptidylprolyl isomerase [Steroidobacteraceae bacterium]